MRSVLAFLIYFITALTGAIGYALAMAAGLVALGAVAALGGHWCWRRWRARR